MGAGGCTLSEASRTATRDGHNLLVSGGGEDAWPRGRRRPRLVQLGLPARRQHKVVGRRQVATVLKFAKLSGTERRSGRGVSGGRGDNPKLRPCDPGLAGTSGASGGAGCAPG